MTGLAAYALEIRRDDVRNARIVALAELCDVGVEDGKALLRIDAFAFTTNNLTYATLGTAGRYLDTFPASDARWGRLPVWGFGTVLRSKSAGVEVGTRYYGFYPISSYLMVQPVSVRTRTFADGTPERFALNPLYAQYTVAPARSDRGDALQMLFRPLLITSFILDDHLASEADFGARQIVVASASSKTAYGMAFMIAHRERSPELIGLTSSRNAAFVKALGPYALVISYDEIDRLPIEPSVYVDFSADAGLSERVKERLGSALLAEIPAGFTHLERQPFRESAPRMFSAPASIKRRIADWGSEAFAARFEAALGGVVSSLERTNGAAFEIVRQAGPQAILDAYRRAAGGVLDPREGLILSLDSARAYPLVR